jgi:hypothetical protein
MLCAIAFEGCESLLPGFNRNRTLAAEDPSKQAFLSMRRVITRFAKILAVLDDR